MFINETEKNYAENDRRIAKKFVNASMKCDFDIDVFYNRVVIDAKSILGVMSLDLTQILTVEYTGEDAEYEAFLDTMEADNVTAA